MLLNRTKSWLLAWGLQLVLAGTAAAQEGVPAFAPGFPLENFQPFAQPDLTGYGSTDRAPTGYFGNVDLLFWAIQAPDRTDIGANGGSRQVYVNNGAPTANNQVVGTNAPVPSGFPASNAGLPFVTQTNSADTGFIRANFQSGERADFGWINDDDRGYLFSGFGINSLTQSMTIQNAGVVFNEAIVPSYNAFIPNTVIGPAAPTAPFTSIGQQTQTVGGTVYLPILYGFVDPTNQGFAADLNRNNIYGPNGRDRGVTTNNVITPGTTLSGRPANEGGADQVTTGAGIQAGGGNAGPAPGITAPGVPKQFIDYGDAVPLPVIFTQLKAAQKTSSAGFEVNRLYRVSQGRLGGTWELFGGARFFNFQDEFAVTGVGGILANSFWQNNAYNRIVGPQVGLRYRRQTGRFGFSFDMRGMAGADFQTVRQRATIGSQLTQIPVGPATAFTSVVIPTTNTNATVDPSQNTTLVYVTQQPNNPGGGPAAPRLNQPLNLNPVSTSGATNHVSFAPLGELRANFNYQLFNSVSLNFGWSGIFLNGVVRSANKFDYSLPQFGIMQGHDQQTVLLNGFNVGVQWNR
jgi:hypothetical protein